MGTEGRFKHQMSTKRELTLISNNTLARGDYERLNDHVKGGCPSSAWFRCRERSRQRSPLKSDTTHFLFFYQENFPHVRLRVDDERGPLMTPVLWRWTINEIYALAELQSGFDPDSVLHPGDVTFREGAHCVFGLGQRLAVATRRLPPIQIGKGDWLGCASAAIL